MSSVKTTCCSCSKEFERSAKEHNRSIKLGRREFCSRSCSGKANGSNLGKHLGNGNVSNLVPNNHVDEFSPFRFFYRKAKSRNHQVDIDLQYLKDLWESQQGLCAISGIRMVLPATSGQYSNTNSPWRASLDRIDNANGYIKGNCQFVCMMANFCKQQWTDDLVVEFAKQTAVNNS